MSLFARSIRYHSSMQVCWNVCHHHGRRCMATTAESMGLVGPRGGGGETSLFFTRLFHLPNPSFENIGSVTTTTSTSLISVGGTIVDSLQSLLGDLSTWFIKRTYQPSIISKRRKHGFRRRKESVGGRRVLKRRMAKGRIRLGGC